MVDHGSASRRGQATLEEAGSLTHAFSGDYRLFLINRVRDDAKKTDERSPSFFLSENKPDLLHVSLFPFWV